MAEQPRAHNGEAKALSFACACASLTEEPGDPWAPVIRHGKLRPGTKQMILALIYRRPRTIAQLAQELGISPPAVHRHIGELHAAELIREVEVPEGERSSHLERYYRPSFPVVLADDRVAFQPILDELARHFAEEFRGSVEALATSFLQTSLPDHEERFEHVLHYLYTTVTRMAREQLEDEGILPPWPQHADGSRWLWWAEEEIGS